MVYHRSGDIKQHVLNPMKDNMSGGMKMMLPVIAWRFKSAVRILSTYNLNLTEYS